MTTFNTTFDWDANLPPSISSLDENDFILLLQKQFPVVNGGDHPITPSTLSKEVPTIGTKPQHLTNFSLPSTTSPLSTDSSPSPPSANDDGSANGSPDGLHHKRTDSGDEDHHKRKASEGDLDDDIGGQPSAKAQHTDSKLKKAANNTRRKSVGGEKNQDESRLLKRKEQNRAAQRAFRERKEKHVKDLEDKVAQLEAKTESQATENENLRDMLSRLRNENLVLKQTAFTFSVPPSSDGSRGPSTSQHRVSSSSDSTNIFVNSNAVPGPSSVPGSAGSSIRTASTHDSPSSLFDGFDGTSGISNSDTPASSSASSNNHNNADAPVPDLDTMAFFSSTGQFAGMSSNPLFTSYRDPTISMNSFAPIRGWDGDINMASSTNEDSSSGFDGLFGDQFSGLIPFSGDFLNADASNGSSLGSSTGARLSPIAHHKPKSASGTEAPLHSGTCPKTKQDIERLVALGGKSTFGAPPVIGEKMSSSGRPASAVSGAPSQQQLNYDAAVEQTFGIVPQKKDCAGDSFNIDELCLEMQRKAKCSYATTSGSQ